MISPTAIERLVQRARTCGRSTTRVQVGTHYITPEKEGRFTIASMVAMRPMRPTCGWFSVAAVTYAFMRASVYRSKLTPTLNAR